MSKKPIAIYDPETQMSALSNNETYIMYFRRLMLLAMTMYKWENVPNNIPVRWIERVLNYYGMGAFVNDPDLGLIFLPCVSSGELNIYNEPIAYNVFSVNYNKRFLASEIVVVRNNYDCSRTSFDISQYAHRLTNVERTIDINIHAQKTPLMIVCPDKLKFTVKNIYAKYDGNEPVIFGLKGIDEMSSIKVMKTDAPYLVEQLNFHKTAIWREALTYLGILSDASQKRERLLQAELQNVSEASDYTANIRLVARQTGIDECNKKFGTNINVKLDNIAEKEFMDFGGEQFIDIEKARNEVEVNE